jgi:hypothetical protein
MKRKDKGRLPPFVPLLISTIDSRAWRAMSHGAKSLYVALKRRVPSGRNRAFLSYREAEAELKSSQHKIREWFKELQHYGFLVLAAHGSLGVDGKGKSPHWRLTELGVTSKASSDGGFEPPTNDFLRWDGRVFDPKPFRRKKQNPTAHGGCTPHTPGAAVMLRTGDTLKNRSVDPGVCIERDESASHGVCITSLTTRGDSDARIVALHKWGSNSRSPKKPWSKPTILSDEPRDFEAIHLRSRRLHENQNPSLARQASRWVPLDRGNPGGEGD